MPLLYNYFFTVRRILICVVAVWTIEFAYLQILVYTFTSLFQMMYYLWFRPFSYHPLLNLEVLNELVILISSYFLFIFTEFVENSRIRFNSGWYLLILTFI